MLDLSKKATVSRTSKLKPGQYTAKVTNVEWAPGYINHSAFKVSYELTDAKGKTFTYSEIFFTNDENDRTAEFYEHLGQNDIPNLGGYAGCTEVVEIGKDVQHNKARLTIYKRTFISQDDEKVG